MVEPSSPLTPQARSQLLSPTASPNSNKSSDSEKPSKQGGKTTIHQKLQLPSQNSARRSQRMSTQTLQQMTTPPKLTKVNSSPMLIKHSEDSELLTMGDTGGDTDSVS